MKTFGDTARINGSGAFAMRITISDGPLGVSWQHASETCEFLGDVFALHHAKQGADYNEARHSIVSNDTEAEVASRFQALIEEITSRDPGELLIERIEANAADENSSGSGLGLLTLMNDYGARLGWDFRSSATGGAVMLSTHAALTLN